MIRPVVVLTVALATAGMPVSADAQAVKVRLPAADSIVSGGGLVHVVADIAAGVPTSAVRARLKDEDLGPAMRRDRATGGSVLHWTARLSPGQNTLEVTVVPPGKSEVRDTRRIYYFAPVFSATDAPTGFRRVPFHEATTEAACQECHRVQPAPADAAPTAPDQSTCYGCHASIAQLKDVHGPAALWACTRCHDPTSSPERYVTPDPVMPLCFGCHQEQQDRFYGNPYQHGPTATGYCTICHNPHGSDQQFFLKKAAWNLCTTCHFEKASGRHVISWGPRGQGHPTKGRPDPSRAGKELSCASCHNPHAAPSPKLWNFGARVWLDLCRNCHSSILGGA